MFGSDFSQYQGVHPDNVPDGMEQAVAVLFAIDNVQFFAIESGFGNVLDKQIVGELLIIIDHELEFVTGQYFGFLQDLIGLKNTQVEEAVIVEVFVVLGFRPRKQIFGTQFRAYGFSIDKSLGIYRETTI